MFLDTRAAATVLRVDWGPTTRFALQAMPETWRPQILLEGFLDGLYNVSFGLQIEGCITTM